MTTEQVSAAESASSAAAEQASDVPVLEVRGLGRQFGSVVALQDVDVALRAGEVTCVVGDNGAGKSVFIKMLCGLIRPSEGEILLDGRATEFASPRQARSQGIVAVYQDLALAPMMSLWRNFFMGGEPVKGWGIFQRFDVGLRQGGDAAGAREAGRQSGRPGPRRSHTVGR